VQFFDDHAEYLEHRADRLILTAQNVEDGVLLLVGDRVLEDGCIWPTPWWIARGKKTWLQP
jgi:hypothetical protein